MVETGPGGVATTSGAAIPSAALPLSAVAPAQDAVRPANELPRRVPSAASAVPVGESALSRVLAVRGQGAGAVAASDLLRSVEAMLRAEAPPGMSSSELQAAAARLVDQQGLVGRLGTPATKSGPYEDAFDTAPSVDTRIRAGAERVLPVRPSRRAAGRGRGPRPGRTP